MSSEADVNKSYSNRRPRPEVAVYRPGSGPLRKSCSNVENIKPSSNGTQHIHPKSDVEGDLAAGLGAVTVNTRSESNRGQKHSSGHQESSRHYGSSRGRRTEDGSTSKLKNEIHEGPKHRNEKCEDSVHVQISGDKPNSNDTNVNSTNPLSNDKNFQDLRERLRDKRAQRAESTGKPEVNKKHEPRYGRQKKNENNSTTTACQEAVTQNGTGGSFQQSLQQSHQSNERERGKRFERRGDRSLNERGNRGRTNVPEENNRQESTHGNSTENNNQLEKKLEQHQEPQKLQLQQNVESDSKKEDGKDRQEGKPRRNRRDKKKSSKRPNSRQDDISFNTHPPDLTWSELSPRPVERSGSRSRHSSAGSRKSSVVTAPMSRPESQRTRPESPSCFLRSPSSPSVPVYQGPPPSAPLTGRQSSEPPVQQNRVQTQVNSGQPFQHNREHRSADRHYDQVGSADHSQDRGGRPRTDGRPPSGRRDGRPALPSNFQSLPPRFKKKLEEEWLQSQMLAEKERNQAAPLMPPPHQQPPHPSGSRPQAASVADDWDGGSITFVSSSTDGVPPRMGPPQQPTGRPNTWATGGRGRGRGRQTSHSFSRESDADDVDKLLVRARSQDSLSGLIAESSASQHSRERKTSFTDSRSSTPSSVQDYNSSSSFLPGALRPLEEVGATQTSLDWSEEMELEDKRSQADDLKYQQQLEQQQRQSSFRNRQSPAPPVTSKMPERVVFASSDIRYRDKPLEGYTVICNSRSSPTGSDKVVSSMGRDQFVHRSTDNKMPTGRPLLGQGRKQENQPPPTNVPGLIQLPNNPPPSQDHRGHPSWQAGQGRGGGILILPPQGPPPQMSGGPPPRFSDSRNPPPFPPHHQYHHPPDNGGRGPMRQPANQRTLYNPANPHKPIMVGQNAREGDVHVAFHPPGPPPNGPPMMAHCPENHSAPLSNDQGSSKPSWYDPNSDSFRASNCDRGILLDIMRNDMELTWLVHSLGVKQQWNRIQMIRQFFQDAMRTLLVTDIRFCELENVEQHIWKISFHNIIEALRKSMADDAEFKDQYKTLLLSLIDEGTSYFESLLELLQETYNFDLEQYLEPQPYPMSGLGYVGLTLVSCQKIFIFLGDLARYREMASDTSNYGKAKSWYTKANLANPKNGRPYNQLAILALYARRKLDAVYLYMRSLMASNPFHSAKESLVSLFDENRKKYEQQERKRREAKEAKRKISASSSSASEPAERIGDKRSVRREIWIHPLDGRRTHRTTASSKESAAHQNSDDEELSQLPSIEINKRFVTSYLNVQGKLYTKIGMETFQECAVQMLREFRALLQHSPLPVNQMRLLQLLALNMFAVSNTQLKDARMAGGYRSAWQEYALIVSLEMFNIMLDKCNMLLKEQMDSSQGSLSSGRLLGEDLQIILPAIKVWCDWLLCHSSVWNPPPTSHDFHVGPPGTPWARLANLINLLTRLSTRNAVELAKRPSEDYEAVKLPEDVALCGFTPLMQNIQEPFYTPRSSDMDLAADCVRIDRLLYFGRDFLCGLDPPVLKLQFMAPSLSEYVSVVEQQSTGPSAQRSLDSDAQVVADQEDEVEFESLSEAEDEDEGVVGDDDAAAAAEIRQLRQRKEELERRHQDQERRKMQLKAILNERVKVELEVRPKLLIADTNCYIDHLATLRRLIQEKHYTLIAPLVVLNELDGLCRCSRLAAEARSAVNFLREKNAHVRYVTSKGAPLPNLTFTMEEADGDSAQVMTNDDRILQCCISLTKDKVADDDHQPDNPDGVRRLRREVVLLTDDRNLRVKALARDVPVRDVPAFLTWTSTSAALKC